MKFYQSDPVNAKHNDDIIEVLTESVRSMSIRPFARFNFAQLQISEQFGFNKRTDQTTIAVDLIPPKCILGHN